MENQPLVSIIIPTFNRAHLINETLDSVLTQTYKNWECIIVDDGSTDNTDEVVGNYVNKDKRFKYFHRPDEHLPGGNGARNYGFKMSQGEYVNWFDSDDLMLPEKINFNMKSILKNNLDFVIDEFENFENQPKLSAKGFKLVEINLRRYIFHEEFWGTCNLLSIRELVKNINYHEKLKSGQEYNFFVKFIIKNKINNGIKIVNPLVLRRIHHNSIQQIQKTDLNFKHSNKLYVYWETFKETKEFLNNTEKLFLIKQLLGYYFSLLAKGKVIISPIDIVKETRKYKSQSLILLSILYWYMITKIGYNKLRTFYLKFT